jgi:hypothetical protein
MAGGKGLSRRRFLRMAAGGLLVAGACGTSTLIKPVRRYWRGLLVRTSSFLGYKSLPPAPQVSGQSAVFRVDNSPRPSWRPASALGADWQASHAGVDALLDLMGEYGLKLYRSNRDSLRSGPNGLIGPEDLVLVKISAQWEQRAMTNTDVVRGLIWRLLDHPDGFTGEVLVVENGQMSGHHLAEASTNNDEFPDHPQSYQSVVDMFVAAGHRVSLYNWAPLREQVGEWDEGDDREGYVMAGPYPLNYPKFITADNRRVSLRYGIWDGHQFDAARLKFINVPVLKAHGWFGVTSAVKNFLGVMSKRVGAAEAGVDPDSFSFHAALTESFNSLPPGLPGSLMALRFPDLNVIDATFVGVHGNRTQKASYEMSPRQGSLLASVDPVALDYYAARHVLLPLQEEVGVETWQVEAADPERDSVFRRYLLASQARLLDAGYAVRFGQEGLQLVARSVPS